MIFPSFNFKPVTAALTGPMRELGTYAAIELLLPGGSLIVLTVWLFRNRAWFGKHLQRILVTVAAAAVALSFPGS